MHHSENLISPQSSSMIIMTPSKVVSFHASSNGENDVQSRPQNDFQMSEAQIFVSWHSICWKKIWSGMLWHFPAGEGKCPREGWVAAVWKVPPTISTAAHCTPQVTLKFLEWKLKWKVKRKSTFISKESNTTVQYHDREKCEIHLDFKTWDNAMKNITSRWW